MDRLKRKKPPRAKTGTASKIDQLPQTIDFTSTPTPRNFQAAFLRRQFGLPAAMAAVVAELHFLNSEALA